MKRLFTFLCLILLIGIHSQIIYPQNFLNVDWHFIGGQGFSTGSVFFPCIVVNSENIPYVAFIDNSKLSHAIVMKWNGTIWEQVGTTGLSAGRGNNICLAFNHAGVPFIACVDSAHADKISVMKFVSNSWTFVGTPGFPQTGEFTSSVNLTFSPSGEPCVGFSEFTSSGNEEMVVMKFNGSDWINIGTSGFSPSWALTSPSLTYDTTGQLYIVFHDNLQKLKVMKFDGANWVMVGQPITTYETAWNASIAISSDGTPYVPFQDFSQESKITVVKFDGNNWVPVGKSGFSSGMVYFSIILFNSSGEPYVAFDDNGYPYDISVMKFNGTDWVSVGYPGFSNVPIYQLSFALSSVGQPFVAFNMNGGPALLSVMEYGESYGIDKLKNPGVSIYPNPASSSICIDLRDFSKTEKNIGIYNITGIQIKKLKIMENFIYLDIREFQPGLYFLKIDTKDKSSILKLIKI